MSTKISPFVRCDTQCRDVRHSTRRLVSIRPLYCWGGGVQDKKGWDLEKSSVHVTKNETRNR